MADELDPMDENDETATRDEDIIGSGDDDFDDEDEGEDEEDEDDEAIE